MKSSEARTAESPPRAPWWMSRRVRWALLLGTATLTTLLIVSVHRHSWLAVLFVVLATVTCGVLALAEHRRPRLPVAAVVLVIAIMSGIAVYRPPRSSADLYSYAMYGRIVSVHHANPYRVVPIDYVNDPIFWKISPIWVRRGSVFGPAYVAFAAGGMAVTGDSGFTIRLFFQMTTALAGAAVLWLIWRRTKSTSALIMLGLHPVFAVTINGGHNDLMIGLAILGAAMLLARNRGWAAGFVLGLAALVKLTALLGLGGAVLWALRRNDRRLRNQLVVASGATFLAGYLPFVTDATHVLVGADRTVTPASLWNPLAAALLGHNAGRDLPTPLAPNTTLTVIYYASMALVALLVLAVGWRHARDRDASAPMGVIAATYPLAAEYTYPWYSLWALPALIAGRRSPLVWVVWIQAAVMLAAWRMPLSPSAGVTDTVVRGTLGYAAPLLCVAAFVFFAVRQGSHLPLVDEPHDELEERPPAASPMELSPIT